MVTEEEARLFYKNKIIKKLFLLSYVFLGVFGLLFSVVSGIGLIVENGSKPSSIFLYITLGFGLFSLIISIILLCLTFINDGDGMSLTKANAVFVIKLILRIINLLGSSILLIGSFVSNIGFDVGNDSWGYFLRVLSIIFIALEGVMCLYNIWNLAWRKENPERYSPGVYIKKIDNTPSKKNVSPKQIAKTSKTKIEKKPDLIEVSEVKEITKKD